MGSPDIALNLRAVLGCPHQQQLILTIVIMLHMDRSICRLQILWRLAWECSQCVFLSYPIHPCRLYPVVFSHGQLGGSCHSPQLIAPCLHPLCLETASRERFYIERKVVPSQVTFLWRLGFTSEQLQRFFKCKRTCPQKPGLVRKWVANLQQFLLLLRRLVS